MSLVGNRSVLHKSPGRFLSGTVASTDRSNFTKPGMLASRFQALSFVFGGIPGGHLAPSSWALPRTAGALASVNEAGLAFSGTGAGAGGITTTGAAAISFAVADAFGELISSGTGAASFTITANGNVLASLNGSGSAAFGLRASATASALAWAYGQADAAVSAAATLRALGAMSGSTQVAEELSPAAVAAAVVDTLMGTYLPVDLRRVVGAAVVGAGTEASPWGPAP